MKREKRAFWIGGMTCHSCEERVKNGLKRTRGVIEASVSLKRGTAEVVYDAEKINEEGIRRAVEKSGYEVLEKSGIDLTRTISLIVILLAVFLMLNELGLISLLAPSQVAQSGMGYGMLFLIGLMTSVHCVAMCGGIGLSQCLPSQKGASFVPAVTYNLGRVISYTAIGFVMGLIGSVFGGGANVGMGLFLQGLIKIVAGVVMILMGVSMLGLFPGLKGLGLRLPHLKGRGRRPLIVGLLNGLMPCGPLQAMWLVALGTESPLVGALSMLVFSLGTVPLMLGLGSFVSALGKKFTGPVMSVGAGLVVVMGLSMLTQGGALSGWLTFEMILLFAVALSVAGVLLSLRIAGRAGRIAARAAAALVIVAAMAIGPVHGLLREDAQEAASAEILDGTQVVYSTLEPGRYPSIAVTAGTQVRWVIDAPQGSINGCNYKMILSDLGIEYTFHTGENVIEFTAEKAGTIQYTCWMGMIRGTIQVVEAGEDAQAAQSGIELDSLSFPSCCF